MRCSPMLEVTKRALGDLKKASKLDEALDLRLFWILNVTLLGIVKDVFWNEDLNRAEENARKLMKNVYENHKNETIFEFVDSDSRNRLLHQYKRDWTGEDFVDYGYVEEGYVEQAEYIRPPFEGKHPVGLIRQAIKWWEGVVEDVENLTT